MEHLPAYVALQPHAVERRVLVVGPSSLEGARRLLDAGARSVHVVETSCASEGGVSCGPWPSVSTRFDLVIAVETYAQQDDATRSKWIARAAERLEPEGWIAAWAPHDDNAAVDFWTLETDLAARFDHVYMLAQLPWQGVSLAPVLGDGDDAPALTLDESLLDAPASVSHYLALATKRTPSSAALADITGRCLLIPTAVEGGADPTVLAEAREALARAEQVTQTHASRLATLEAELERRETELQRATARAARDVKEHERRLAIDRREHNARLQEERNNSRAQLRIEAERIRREEAARAQRERTVLQGQLREREQQTRKDLDARVEREVQRREGEVRREVEQLLAQERLAAQALLEQAKQRATEERARLERRHQDDSREANSRREALTIELSRIKERAANAEQQRTELAALEERSQQAREETLRAVQARDSLQAELEAEQARAKQAQTDLSILTRSVHDLESAVSRANESSQQRQEELAARDEQLSELRSQVRSLEAERGSLTRQMEVALAEREGARQLSERVDAELQLTRRRAGEHEEALAARLQDVAKLTTDVEVVRAELEHHKSMLLRARSREEELSASAAQGVEQGRMLAEVATDRDRLRDELAKRAQQIQTLEERLWSSREELERARLDNVRLAGDAERLRDQAERAHRSEAEQAQALQRLNAELHQLELAKAELGGTVRAQDDEIERLRTQTQTQADDSEEMAQLRTSLGERGKALAEVSARAEQLAAREGEATSLAQRRERQLSEAGEELERLRKSAEQNAATALTLEGEVEVKSLEVEQLAASVTNLQIELETRRKALEQAEDREDDMRRALEQARGEQESLRRRLREREQELDDIASANETSGVELYKLRRELEAAAEANEQLEQQLDTEPAHDDSGDSGGSGGSVGSEGSQPALPNAVAAIKRVQAHLAQWPNESETSNGSETRVDALRLEIEIRAEEQEHMLRQLEAAEQKIWEMTDAADRNAARLAASLAQLEKHKEELDETRDELEVGRKLLQAAEARALEQERLLATERARLARVGAESSDAHDDFDDVDELFADLGGESANAPKMVDLGSNPSSRLPPGVPAKVVDPVSSTRLGSGESPRAPRMVVEALGEPNDGDDDPWNKGVVAAPGRRSEGDA